MKRIGILGGSSDQATADYYRRLNKGVNDRLGGFNTAEVIISSMNFAFSADCVQNNKWDEVGAYLAERAKALEGAGAELLLCVSNTLHRTADTFTSGLSIPFLHIADVTGEAIVAAGLNRVALLGTRMVMSGDHIKHRLAERYGVEVLVPDAGDQVEIDRIIFDELCRGEFKPEAKAKHLAVMRELQARGAQGAILGCTEIPLLVSQEDAPDLPMFDTTGLHVAAAIEMALA